MFNISGCVPKRPNDIVYLVLAKKIDTSAYLHSTGITHQACFILAEHDDNICWLKWWETILSAPTKFWKTNLKIVDGVICGRPLLYWHKVGSAWGRQYPPYSDTIKVFVWVICIWAWLRSDTVTCSSFPRSQSRSGCRSGNISPPSDGAQSKLSHFRLWWKWDTGTISYTLSDFEQSM